MHDHKNSSADGHAHSSGAAAGRTRVLWWVLVLSGSYLMAEIVGGIVSGSLALIADAGHMALDVAATALGLFAFWISRRPPTPEKTYGYYRAEILAALLNSVTLVVVSVWIFYEAWERFSNPPAVQGLLMAVIAAGGLIINLVALFLISRQSRENLNMRGVWLHLLTDTLGSVAALVAAFFVWRFQWNLADPIISVVIGVLILAGAWKLLLECIDVLMVSVPKGIDVSKIQSDIRGVGGVIEIHDLHVWAMNSGLTALSAHVRTSAEAGLSHTTLLQSITNLLKDRFRITHVTLQIESPDFRHEGDFFCLPGQILPLQPEPHTH